MAEPLVSVIVTSYNVASYIRHAVESALAQDVPLEIIAVDDASTDNTFTILQSIPGITAIRLEKNGGPSAARNAGIARARGQWLAVLDGDDAFLEGRLSRCLAAAQNADIVIDNLLTYRESDGHTAPMFARAYLAARNPLSLAAYIEGNLLFSGGHTLGYTKPVFRAAFLKQHQLTYDEAIRIGEDYHLMAEALASGARCAVLSEPGYRYTIRKGSISHRLTLADIERMQATDAKLLARHKLTGAAAGAQKRRQACFARAAAFTRLIDALKTRNLPAAACTALKHPSALWLLHMPVMARLRRLLGKPA